MPVPMRPPPITTTSLTALVAMPLRFVVVCCYVSERWFFLGWLLVSLTNYNSPADDVGQHCWEEMCL